MRRILVLNGPNINMLGIREKNIYGREDYDSLCAYIQSAADRLGVQVELLKRGGLVVFIDRKPENILGSIEGDERPLLADDKQRIFNLYAERIDLYRQYADCIIENNSDFGSVLRRLLQMAEKLEG